MGADIFDNLAATKDSQQPASPPALPPAKPGAGPGAQTVGGDIFDQIHAGTDVRHPEREQAMPGELDPADTGFLASLKRNTMGLMRLPGHVIKAFSQPAETDQDKALVNALGNASPLPDNATDTQKAERDLSNSPAMAILGFKRLIVDPMIAEHEQAKAYEAMYDKMSESEKREAEKFFNLSSARHLANMHHIGTVIPLLGPVAAPSVDRAMHGDVSGGLTDVLFNIVTAGLMHNVAGKVKGLAPGVRTVAGEKIPVLASQEGESLAPALEGTAKATGSAKPLQEFVGKQREALGKSTLNTANAAVQEAVDKLNQNSGLHHETVNIKPQDFLEKAGARAMKETNPVSVDEAAEAYSKGNEVAPPEIEYDKNGNVVDMDGLKRARGAVKAGMDRIPVIIKRPMPDAPYALSKAANFQDAAEILRSAAKPKLNVVDNASKGRLGEIMTERDSLVEKTKTTTDYGEWRKIQRRLSALNTEEDTIFRQHDLGSRQSMSTAPGGMKRITPEQRTQFNQAARIWKQANAMDQLHGALDGATDGAAVARRIGVLGDDVIRRAVGGNEAHFQSIKETASLLSSGNTAAKAGSVIKALRFVTSKASLGSSAAFSYGISKILTSPRAANLLSSGIRSGMAIPTIAQSIDRVLQSEQVQEQ